MRKILVGDDEIRIRLLYEEVLTEAGYRVIAAKDGKEVCEKFKDEKPDLVILDVKMPGMHGIEALERIREMDKDVPVIISTAYQKHEYMFPGSFLQSDVVISTSDVAAFITKPIDINNLRLEVKKILAERETGSEVAEDQKQRVVD